MLQYISNPVEGLDLVPKEQNLDNPTQGDDGEPPAPPAAPPAPLPVPIPGPSGALKLPEVPENKKGWLKGPALEFLEMKHLPRFVELYDDAPTQAQEYADVACNELHHHFDFHLPMNVTPKHLYDPSKILLTEELLLKTTVVVQDRVSVLNWLQKVLYPDSGMTN